MNEQTILIVEDDDALRGTLRRYLGRAGHRVLEAADCKESFRLLKQTPDIDVILADIVLPDGQGFELIDQAATLPRRPSVIIMTGNGNLEYAVTAIQRGAADFLTKPFSLDALDDALLRAKQRKLFDPKIEAERELLPMQEWRQRYAPSILGEHRSLIRIFTVIERISDTDCSVIITGESGTGKELIARAVHESSDRRDKPFITVNCAAIPENLLESELFGHVKGSFTGATSSRIGRFTAADGGTIFLDEIGEMPPPLQAKLLRVLQEKEVTPVGEIKAHKIDIRIISATNIDLDDAIDAKIFREDLLYRLNVIPIQLPALRDRPTDIPGLVQHFIARCNERRSRSIDAIDDEALKTMVAYEWPGNIRQLENTVERMVILKTEGSIDVDDLPPKVRKTSKTSSTRDAMELPADGINLKDAVENFENALIVQALERTGWNKNRAASILQMNRTTLVEKLKKKNLAADQSAN